MLSRLIGLKTLRWLTAISKYFNFSLFLSFFVLALISQHKKMLPSIAIGLCSTLSRVSYFCPFSRVEHWFIVLSSSSFFLFWIINNNTLGLVWNETCDENEGRQQKHWNANLTWAACRSEIFFCRVFSDVRGLVHHPIECCHLQLLLQLDSDFYSYLGVVAVEPFFLEIRLDVWNVRKKKAETSTHIGRAEWIAIYQLCLEGHKSLRLHVEETRIFLVT